MIYTRENMSPELRWELKQIEAHERSVAVKVEIDDAIDAHLFYVASTFGPGRHNQEVNPFEMRVFWDEGFGTLMKVDFRTEMIEKLHSMCETGDLYFLAAKAMRGFADELEVIAASIDAPEKE